MRKNYSTSIVKCLIIAFVISNGYIILFGKGYSFESVSNIFFIIGLGYLILGLFRLTRVLKFFDLLIFGWKKLIEIIVTRNYSKKNSKTGEYIDYLKENKYCKSYIELIVIGIVILLISAYTGLKV